MIEMLRYLPKDNLPERFTEEQTLLIDKYKISRSLSACFIVNFENEYICHRLNGGCKNIRKCREINKKESANQT